MTAEFEPAHFKSGAAIRAVGETLRRIDPRLMDHGERVAFAATELCRLGGLELDEEKLFLLSVFHDIGAYKTDEIDRMVEFETRDVWNHSIYGSLFLKHMTPLSDMAEAILYHHSSWTDTAASGSPWGEYAALLHLADRLDIIAPLGPDSPQLRFLCSGGDGQFRPEYAALLKKALDGGKLLERLRDGSYAAANQKLLDSIEMSDGEVLDYLKMIAYSIDFRSEFTVTHTINTVAISLALADRLELDPLTKEKIYIGALLHDVGKIAVPVEILEFPGKLTDEQMTIMRTHVVESERLIRNVVTDEICDMAVRHHEKLDGSGYPMGLTGESLTVPQRIVAVADIVSALSSRRSYKEPFPKEKTVGILRRMEKSQLDKEMCDYICDNYDSIMALTDSSRAPVIQSYRAIKDEYEELKKRFAG